MKYSIMFYLLIMSFLSSAQSNQIRYYNLVNHGEYLKYKGYYEKANEFYRKAFTINAHHHAKDYLAAASICFHIGQPDTAIKYFKTASHFAIGFNKYVITKLDSYMYAQFKSRKDWSDIYEEGIARGQKIRDSLEKDSTFKVKEKMVYTLSDSDVYYTKIRSNCIYNLSKEAPEYKLSMKNDSLFYERYYSYLLQNGYPGYWVTNTDVLQCLNVHIGPSEKFKTLLKKEYENGNMVTSEYVYFIDRFYFETKEKCGLGLYTSRFCDPERDWLNVFQLRIAYGMSPFLTEPRRSYNYNMETTGLLKYVDNKYIEEFYTKYLKE